MAVTPTLVAMVSQNQIVIDDVNGPFTTATYNTFAVDAQSIVDFENDALMVKLPSTLYDRCNALMICHLWVMGNPSMQYSAQRFGDFSASQVPGESVYSLQYHDIFKRWNQQSTPQTMGTVTRADVDMSWAKLDSTPIISPWTSPGEPAPYNNPWGLMP